jgi:hypothetical protein
VARVGIEPTAFEILSLDGLPIAYRAVMVLACFRPEPWANGPGRPCFSRDGRI